MRYQLFKALSLDGCFSTNSFNGFLTYYNLFEVDSIIIDYLFTFCGNSIIFVNSVESTDLKVEGLEPLIEFKPLFQIIILRIFQIAAVL